MRERPILLNGDMVRAVLNGSKTQLRHIINWLSTRAINVGERDVRSKVKSFYRYVQVPKKLLR